MAGQVKQFQWHGKTMHQLINSVGNPMSKYIIYVLLVSALATTSKAFAYDPLDCMNDVVAIDSTITTGLATRLCSATWSPEPVLCYGVVSLADDTIPRGIAIDLCAGSTDAKRTVQCYVDAGTQRKLNRGLSTTLCGARKEKSS